MSTNTQPTGLASVIRAAQQAVEPVPLEPGAIYAMLDGDGQVVVRDTMRFADAPARPQRRVTLTSVDSFIELIAMEDNEDTQIFTDGLTTVAIMDAHGWRQDRIELHLQASPEWTAWRTLSGQLVSQLQFADFLETQLSTIIAPDGATLLEIAQSMEANTKVDWKSAEWLANGARSFKFDEQVQAKAGRTGQLEIPAQFTLALRPFVGCDPFEVKANLRYRIEAGALRIGFNLVEPERRLEAAVDEVTNQICRDTHLPVFRGRPD
jgi:uncharacterized protein YfdQ (DUF2303 family)